MFNIYKVIKVVLLVRFDNPYLKTKTKIQLLERWIIVHSVIYYKLDSNIVPDHVFDKNCVQLVRAIKKYPLAFKETKYYKVFKGFRGETGFGLWEKLRKYDKGEADYLFNIAQHLIKKHGWG